MARDDPDGRPALRHNLAFRFGLVLCFGVAALFVLMGTWNIMTQREHLLALTTQTAERASSIIRGAARDGMLHNDPDRVGRVIGTITKSEGVRRVRILDRDGRVRHASGPGSTEKVLPLSAYQCQICHRVDPIPTHLDHERRMREVTGEDGHVFLNVVEPIPNEPDCSSAACHVHPEDRRVLGIIDIELPLTEVNQLLVESETQLGLGLLVTLVLVLALGIFLTWRMVLRPVGDLARATEQVAAGDLTTRVPQSSTDEIGRMARSFNVMVERLGVARGELEAWSQTLGERVDAKTEELSSAHQRMLVVEKMAALGKLAAVVAHEINNPLAGIATYAKLLRKRFSRIREQAAEAGEDAESCVDEDSMKALELVEHEASRCGTIVKNLLLFSRTPGARFAEEDLGGLIERCVLLVNHKAELQEVEVQVQMDEGVPRVACDASQIQQVVLALTMNAIEAMPAGGTVKIHVAKAEEMDIDGVMLEVVDTGCGIPTEDLPQVFEPFFSTKEQGEGVGLGLSIVYGIVERHHGRINVYSVPGEGTAFRIHLPRTQPTVPAEAETGEGGVL